MSYLHSQETPTVIVLSACQEPGPKLVRALALSGARVIAIDGDGDGLATLAQSCPDRIEPLMIEGFQINKLQILKEAWGDEPIDLVVNLMPLAHPVDISEMMRGLSMVMRSMIKGLIRARGCLANVVAQPNDRLSLGAQGLLGAVRAASAALGEELADKSVRVQLVSVPRDRLDLACDILHFFSTPASQNVVSTEFHLN